MMFGLTMSPLRWVGIGLFLAGAALTAFLWFGYVGSQKKLGAADARLQADTEAFQNISRVDRNTALVLSNRQARQDAQTKVHSTQKETLQDAIAKSPTWADERVPDAVLNGLR